MRIKSQDPRCDWRRDLYDGDWKDYGTGLFFRGQMARLKQKGIPVYLIAGNCFYSVNDCHRLFSKLENIAGKPEARRTVVAMVARKLSFSHQRVAERFARLSPV